MISDKDKQYLLSLQYSDITATLLTDLIGDRYEKGKIVKSRFNTYDEFYLDKNEYFNTEKILTNVGLFIYNKFIVETNFKKVLGYINTPITGSVFSMIENKLARALLDDIITVDSFVTYINNIQWLSLQFNSMISSSFTMNTITPIDKVVSTRDKLLKDNKKDLDNGDIVKAVEIEKTLVNMAKEELKNDPGMALYDSGARGNFNNNYKATTIMKGPIFNPITGTWDVVGKSYTEGLEKKDITPYANGMITSQYPKSVGTQIAGTLYKQLTAGFQSIVLDDAGSDCGTTETVKTKITQDNYNLFIDRYIVVGQKTVLLSNDVIASYIGKEVNLRTVMCCKNVKKCSKCAGELYYKLGINSIGLATSKMSGTILNLNMKKFHDSSAKVYDIDINDISL